MSTGCSPCPGISIVDGKEERCHESSIYWQYFFRALGGVAIAASPSSLAELSYMMEPIPDVLQDVEATVLRAAQANLVTAAAQRVLDACKQAGRQPPEQVRCPPQSCFPMCPQHFLASSTATCQSQLASGCTPTTSDKESMRHQPQHCAASTAGV